MVQDEVIFPLHGLVGDIATQLGSCTFLRALCIRVNVSVCWSGPRGSALVSLSMCIFCPYFI